MAANITKWWKAKFLNGYKSFSVVPTDCSDGRPSDTEELLGRHQDSSATSEKDAQDDKASNKNSPSGEKRQLNFEEFECDVSVEGGVEDGRQERQEFSFTLYDFDGHGKITKDDIAGLVTTIYEALGSSIKVPHYGSKTIKVKLTVSPDQREGRENSTHDDKVPKGILSSGPTGSTPTHGVKFKKDLNVTIRESRRPRRRRRCAENKCNSGMQEGPASCGSSCRSGEDGAADVSEDEEEEDRLGEREIGSHHSTPRTSRDSNFSSSRRYRSQHCSAEVTNTPRHRHRKRSNSLQREQLLHIIQANMEKNNLSFHTPRKPCSDHQVGMTDVRHSVPHSRHKTCHQEPLTYLQAPDPRYLDLAGVEPDYHYGAYPRTLTCYAADHFDLAHHRGWRRKGHHRSHSHDLSNGFRYNLLDHHSHAKSSTHRLPLGHERKFPTVAVGHSSSPHHLKHRNREEDQARAMAQVVRWLEQEFSSSLNTTEKLKNEEAIKTPTQTPKRTPQNSHNGPETPKQEESSNPTSPSVERHEHHHVHEHIHHHYHHYQEMPILV